MSVPAYVYCVRGYIFLLLYIFRNGGKDFNFSIYCFFSVPRQTNTHSHAHTRPVLISIPSPRVTTSPFGGGGDCDYDDDSGDDDGLHPGMAALRCCHPRALSLAPAPKTANLNLRSFLFSFFCLHLYVVSTVPSPPNYNYRPKRFSHFK